LDHAIKLLPFLGSLTCVWLSFLTVFGGNIRDGRGGKLHAISCAREDVALGELIQPLEQASEAGADVLVTAMSVEVLPVETDVLAA
jgi:hypothetical protein